MQKQKMDLTDFQYEDGELLRVVLMRHGVGEYHYNPEGDWFNVLVSEALPELDRRWNAEPSEVDLFGLEVSDEGRIFLLWTEAS